MSKENLNLPKTAFSMKANLPQKEPDLIDFWNKINLYENLRINIIEQIKTILKK